MERLIIKLRDLVTRETAVYCDLLELSKKKKDAIVKNSIPELNSLVMDELKVLKSIDGFESEREELLGSFSAENGIKEPHIRDLIGMAKEAVREEIEGLLLKLEDTASEIQRLNALNKTLIETHLNYTSFCINLMTGQQDTVNVYSGSGRLSEKRTTSRSLLDQTI